MLSPLNSDDVFASVAVVVRKVPIYYSFSGSESCLMLAVFAFKFKVSIILKWYNKTVSYSEAKLTGLRARNCTTIQKILIFKCVFAREMPFEKQGPGQDAGLDNFSLSPPFHLLQVRWPFRGGFSWQSRVRGVRVSLSPLFLHPVN